jgi:two-component system, OmpR family, response regulator
MKILIIEDDPGGSAILIERLAESGHHAVHASNCAGGLALATSGNFDVLIVDRLLPDGDGLNIVTALRADQIMTPAVFVTALDDVGARVAGLRAGGDDYIAKPFSFMELLARLEAVTRRNASAPDAVLRVDDLEMNLIARTVTRGESEIRLKPGEFRLLEFMMRHAGQTVSRTMLLNSVWKHPSAPEKKLIEVQVSRLRKKIDHGAGKPLINTVRGAGYCIRAA